MLRAGPHARLNTVISEINAGTKSDGVSPPWKFPELCSLGQWKRVFSFTADLHFKIYNYILILLPVSSQSGSTGSESVRGPPLLTIVMQPPPQTRTGTYTSSDAASGSSAP